MKTNGRLSGWVGTVFFCVFLLFGTGAGAQGPAPGISLPDSLKDLGIREGFVPSPGFQQVARIDALNGTVVVIHRATTTAYFARPGDAIFENDAIETLDRSRCRVRFQNEDVVTMAAGTRFGVDEYRDGQRETQPRSRMSVLKGKVMFYALRLFSRGTRDVTVSTPTAVAGVRGTKFGIHVYWKNHSAAGPAGVRVAGLGMDGTLRMAQAVNPGQSFTDCFSEDGVLDVNGRTIAPGTMYRGQDGTVVPTPPSYVRTFESETSVQGDGSGGDQGGGEGEDAGNGDGAEGTDDEEGDDEDSLAGSGDSDPGALADVADVVTDTTVQETGEQTAGEGGAVEDIANGKIIGRGSGIILFLVHAAGGPWVAPGKGPFYKSDRPDPLASGGDRHTAYESMRGEDEPDFRLFLDETDASGNQAKVTEFDWGFGGNNALATPRTFTYFQAGSYKDVSGHSFLEWGWWEDTGGGVDQGKVGTFSGSDFYAATSKIWHIEGDQTHPDYITYLHQQNAVYSYSGEAYGVFVDSSVPESHHLAGTFSCCIDFGSRNVPSFQIDAAGGGQTVHLSGTGDLDPDGTFEVDDLSGTLSGHGTQNDPTFAAGMLCGPKAEGAAGVWQAHDGSDYWATGEFHGKR